LTGCAVKLAAQFVLSLNPGKPLRTLRDAANHVIALPAPETKRQYWQTAMACLLSAAEKGGIFMAGAALFG
jgi:hypothetical protein